MKSISSGKYMMQGIWAALICAGLIVSGEVPAQAGEPASSPNAAAKGCVAIQGHVTRLSAAGGCRKDNRLANTSQPRTMDAEQARRAMRALLMAVQKDCAGGRCAGKL